MAKKIITLETPIEIEMKLDKNVFNRDNFTIARVFTDTMEVQEYLNKIWKNISVKGNFPKMKPNVVYKGTVTEIEKDDKYGYSFSMANVVPRDFMSGNIKNDKDFCLFVEIFIGEGTANRLRGVKGVLKAVKNKDMDFLMSINGIGEYTANKIIETFETDVVGSEQMMKLKKLNFTDNEIDKLKEKFGKTLVNACDVVDRNIFSLIYYGFRLDRMDNIFLEYMDGDKSDKRRITAYIFRALKDYMYDGYKSYVPLDDFYNTEIITNIRSNVGKDVIDKCIKELIKDDKLVIVNKEIITTADEWHIESNLVDLLNILSKTQCVLKLPIDDIDYEIDQQEKIIGFKLNQGQRQTVKDILMSDKQIAMINGKAGTGKTTITKVVLNIYKKYGRGNFFLCALSGRASSILGESSGYVEQSQTIHRTVGIGKQEGYNFVNKYPDELDILCVDEISMLDYWLLSKVIEPCNPNTKIILLGDDAQLPSLSFGKSINTLRLFDSIDIFELTQVMRQSENSMILEVSNKIREGKNIFEKTKYKWYGDDVEVCIGDSYQYMIKSFIEKYKEDPTSSIVCTTTKQKVDRVNFDIQEILIQEGFINTNKPSITKPSSTKGKYYEIFIGDYIMILKNNYEVLDFTGHTREDYWNRQRKDIPTEEPDESMIFGVESVFNGEIYKVIDIFEADLYDEEDESMVIVFTDGKKNIAVNVKELECQLAYASTGHKLQGSGFPNVFVYFDTSYVDMMFMNSKQWLYTACTRSKKFLSIHTNDYKALASAIRKDAIDEKITLIDYCFDNNVPMKKIDREPKEELESIWYD